MGGAVSISLPSAPTRCLRPSRTMPSVYAGSAGQSVSASATAAFPIVATVQPSTGPLSGGQSVIVSGQNFQTGATVGFGNWATVPGQWIDSSHLRVTTPSFPNEGVISITVTNPDGQ